MGGRGGSGVRNSQPAQADRFAGNSIEMKTFNKLPKYIQDAVIAVDSYNPRSYGYNEPINYHIYYVNKDGVITFFSEEGADFLGEMRSWGKAEFGKVDDWVYTGNYNEGEQLERRRK